MKKGKLFVLIAVVFGFILAQVAMADVLFKYPVEANEALTIGTIVKLDPTTDRVVKATSTDRDIIGVVVGYELDGVSHNVLVGSSGQLSIQVASAVTAGDRLTITGIAGQAATAVNDEDVFVAVALEDAAGPGTIIAQIMIDDNQAKYSAFDDGFASLGADNVQSAIDSLDATVDGLSSGSWNHNDLASIDGGAPGEYYHLTAAQHSDLTGAGNADAQHSHDADNILGVTAGDHISSTDVDGALTDLDGAIEGIFTGDLPNLTNGAGIATLDYDGSVADQVEIDNTWFDGDAQVSTAGAVAIQDDAVQASDIDWGTVGDQVQATDLTYDPTADGDWVAVPTQAGGALDELAQRIDDIEDGGVAQDLENVLGVGNSTGNNSIVDATDNIVEIGDTLEVSGDVKVETGNALRTDFIYASAGSYVKMGSQFDLNGHAINNSIDTYYDGDVVFNDDIVPMSIDQDLGKGANTWDDINLGDNTNIYIDSDAGAAGEVLTIDPGTGFISWAPAYDGLNDHITGNGLTGSNYNGSAEQTWTVDDGNGIGVDGTGVYADVHASGAITNDFASSGQLGVNVDGSTIGISGNKLEVNDDGIQDEHIDWSDVEADDMPYDPTSSGIGATDVQAAIDSLDVAIDAIDYGEGQQVLSSNFSSAISLNSTSTWSNLVSVTYASTITNPIVIDFTGTFDDKGGQNGAYFEVRIYNGSAEIAGSKRTIIINDRNYHQSQEVSVNAHIASPVDGTTYTIQAKQVKAPYDSGRAVNGTITLIQING